jgi:hypothetical protein
MRTVACAGLALILAGCGSMASQEASVAPPSPGALETGDCHTLAQEHEAEAAWLDLDADTVKRVFTATYDDCQQWNAAHVWKPGA